MPKNLGVDTFPDPVRNFGAPWRPFWILQAVRRCRRWASAPGAARLVFVFILTSEFLFKNTSLQNYINESSNYFTCNNINFLTWIYHTWNSFEYSHVIHLKPLHLKLHSWKLFQLRILSSLQISTFTGCFTGNKIMFLLIHQPIKHLFSLNMHYILT